MFGAVMFERLYSLATGRKDHGDAGHSRRGGRLLRAECLESRQLLSISPLPHVATVHAKPADTPPAIVTTLQSLPKTSFYGAPVVLVAKVTGASGGDVEFFDGTTELGDVNLSTRGTVTYVVNSLGLGPHTLTAEYFSSTNTDKTTADSTSKAVTETVKAAPTLTTVVASSEPGVAGTSVSFTAMVGSFASILPKNSASVPGGTVNFTVTNTAGGTAITGSVALNSAGAATFTPDAPLDAGTYTVVAAFAPADSNYAASTSRTLHEKVIAASAAGVGSVTAGTADAPVTLRNGTQLYVNITQSLDGAGVLSESADSIVTYSDSSHGISLTSTTITSVVFGRDGKVAEISGIGTNGTAGTPVNFTLTVNAGGDRWFSRPSMAISIYGAGIDYHAARGVAVGGISVDQTGSSIAMPPTQLSANDYALDSVLSDGRNLGFFDW